MIDLLGSKLNPDELLSSSDVHNQFLENMHIKYGLKVIYTIEDLKTQYEIDDYLTLESLYYKHEAAKQNIKNPLIDVIGNKMQHNARISKKFQAAKNNFILPCREISTRNRALGCAYPTLELLEFEFDINKIFLISIAVINEIWGVKDVDFFGDTALSTDQKLLNLLNYMDLNNASDFHILRESEYSYELTMRMHGVLKKILGGNNGLKPALVDNLISHMLLEANIDTHTQTDEIKGVFRKRLFNHVRRTFRLSIVEHGTSGGSIGKSVAVRRMPIEEDLKSLEKLGYPHTLTNFLKKFLSDTHQGLVLVTGPTGSGKSTLLYAILILLRELGNRILTLEDPPEVYISGTTQIDLMSLSRKDVYKKKNQIDLDFELINKVKEILMRQDPDVALVGEARSASFIKQVVDLALTGHLGLTTLHSTDNRQAIKRILQQGNLDEEVLIDTLKLILTLELIPCQCQECEGTGFIDKEPCYVCNKDNNSTSNIGIVGMLPVFEMSYFNGLSYGDNIFDYGALKASGKLLHISKADVAKDYYEKGAISEIEYQRLCGLSAANLMMLANK